MKSYLSFKQFIAAAAAALVVALTMFAPAAYAQDASDSVENSSVDFVFRAQTWTIGANFTFRLYTTACSDSAGGTEVTGGSYAAPTLARSLTNWAGTQSAGSTTASTGTGGVTSNNVAINFPTPTAGWGTVTHLGITDGATLYYCKALTTSKTINTSDTVSFPIGSLTVTFQ